MKKNLRHPYFLFIIMFFSLILLLGGSEWVAARPGGGHSYSGGGSGGSGGGELIGDLIILILSLLPPELQVPAIILVIIITVVVKAKKRKNKVVSAPTYENIAVDVSNVDRKIETFKNDDPSFSRVLFLDFITSIYNKYYSWFGKPEFSNLQPFLSDEVLSQSQVSKFNKREINEIVVGNIQITDLKTYSEFVAISVDIDANYTVIINDISTRYIVTERWLLNRKKGLLSQDPQKMHDVSCPNCGAPTNFTDAGQCRSCSTFISKGDMQWFVKDRKVITQEVFSTSSLVNYAEEKGTDLPTIYQEDLDSMMSRFSNNHKNVPWSGYWEEFSSKVVNTYFKEIYEAWSSQKWNSVRHLVSDRLFETNNFWQEAFKRQKLVNKLDSIEIQEVEMVRIDLDKYYESFTVRVYASCFDYVEDRFGKVLGGSKRTARKFSEYWTFIRKAGVTKELFNLKTCPNCGAPADKMGQAAVCEYCGSKISTGQFSWVLSMITQDEAYKG